MRTSVERALRVGASAAVATALSAAGSVAAAAPPGPSTTTTSTTTSPPAPASTTPTTRPPASSSTVETVSQPVPNEYIVILKGVAPGSVPTEAQGLASKHGGAVFAEYQHALQGFAVRMNAAQAADLAREPKVAKVQENGIVHASTTESPSPWGLDRIDQRQLPLDVGYRYGGDGTGVHAYIIDTGIRITHQDFGGRASFGADFAPGPAQPPGTDCFGHGTHVAGTLGGTTYGVAKSVSLVEVRVLDCTGSGSDSDVINGIDWVTTNAIQPAVANMSLGGSPDQALDTALTNSINNGITYAVAAGNSGGDACNASPSDDGGTNGPALTAAASDMNDTQASFSNGGPCVDLYAPGVGVISDYNTSDTATMTLRGTSMATPHVAGTAALYLGTHQLATPAMVKSVLTSDATPNVISSPTFGTPNRLVYTGPGVPAPFTATPGASSIQLSWTPPADGGSSITSYSIYKGTRSGNETLLGSVSGSTTSFNDTSLTCGGTYYYQVSAVTVVDEGRQSAEQSAAPTTLAPCAPLLNPPTAASHVVHLSWGLQVGSGNVTTFKIYRGTSAGGETLLTSVSNQFSFADIGLTNGTTYFYKVSAVSGSNEAKSSEQSATPSAGAWTFIRNSDSSVIGRQTINSAWTNWQYLGGCVSSNIATTSSSATVSIFSVGCDGALWYQQYNGAWPGWTSLGGAINSTPAVVTDASGIWVFDRAADSAIWYRHFTGGSWTAWQSLGGGILGNPAAVVDSTGVSLFVRGGDNGLWSRHFNGSSWSGWQNFGGWIISDPSLTTGTSGTFVFAVGGDHAGWGQRFPLPGGPWSGWQPLGGCLYSNIAPVSTSPGASAFALGCDFALWVQQYTGSWSGFQPLGSSLRSNPAAVVDPSGIWVVVRAADQAPWFRHFTSGTWTPWQSLSNYTLGDPALTVG